MTSRNNGYAARLIAAALATALLALAGCTGDTGQAKTEDTPDLVWPLPPEQPRIKYVESYRSRSDVEETTRSATDVLLGRNQQNLGDGLKKPQGVHVDRDGRIFVADTGHGKVVVFDRENRKFEFWGTEGQGFLQQPLGVTSDGTGRIFVTDRAQKRVVVFDRLGKFESAIGKRGDLEGPAGIALDESRQRIYVVDTTRHHIVVFDFDGNLVKTIGQRGGEAGQFNFPTNLAVDRAGKLYVSDSMNFRVQILDEEGNPLKTFGKNGRNLGDFSRAKGIAVDSDDHIYVVDAAFSNFQIFNQEGELLLFVGSIGQEAGQFWLPAGAYIDREDRIYVVDQYNTRIQVFQYLGEPAEQPVNETVPADSPGEPSSH